MNDPAAKVKAELKNVVVFKGKKEEPPKGSESKRLIIDDGEIDRVVEEMDEILLKTNKVFQRRNPDEIVYVAKGEDDSERLPHNKKNRIPLGTLYINPLDKYAVAQAVQREVDVFKFDKRTGELRKTDIKPFVSQNYESYKFKSIPEIVGLSSTPLMREDGSIRCQDGYDPESRRYIDWKLGDLDIPDNLTREDVEKDYQMFRELNQEFFFADKELDGAVAIAAQWSGIARLSLDKCPAFGFEAPKHGSGKTLLCELAGILTSGADPMPITHNRNDNEFEKRVESALLSKTPVLCFDNLNHLVINSNALNSAITSGKVNIRIFHSQEDRKEEVNSLILLNGNNMQVSEDSLRRIFMCTLDTDMETPASHKYKRDGEDLKRHAHRNRKKFIEAFFRIEKAYRQSGEEVTGEPLVGFESWLQRIRDPLLWISGVDIMKKLNQTRFADPEREDNLALFTELSELEWNGKSMKTGMRAKEILDAARENNGEGMNDQIKYAELYSLLHALCDGKLNAGSLGKKLSGKANQRIGDFKLVKMGGGGKSKVSVRWRMLVSSKEENPEFED